MSFNSFEFLIFLPIVFFLYWLAFKKNAKLQNVFLIVASYFFYGWWNWKCLGLIFVTSVTCYLSGVYNRGRYKQNQSLEQSQKSRDKWGLIISLIINLGVLFFFKYYNFTAYSNANTSTN